jgi:Type I phosphodiesterase / nucleotide pyrophosphatase
MAKRVLVLDPVCLTLEHLADRRVTPTLSALAEEGYAVSLRPPFPAVTCTAQATLTTRLDEGLVPWCYSKPVGFYERLAERQGEFQPPW